MLELASVGAKVLQTRSVELAMNERVRVQVLSSFDATCPGTLVVDEDEIVEKQNRVRHRLFARRREDHAAPRAGPAGHRRRDVRRAGRANVNVDMIVQNVSADGTHRHDLHRRQGRPAARAGDAGRGAAADRLRRACWPIPNVAKISVVGVGMRSHAGVANTMFRALADKAINIQVISTSEIKVSVLIAAEYTELAVRALHTAYGLDAA